MGEYIEINRNQDEIISSLREITDRGDSLYALDIQGDRYRIRQYRPRFVFTFKVLYFRFIQKENKTFLKKLYTSTPLFLKDYNYLFIFAILTLLLSIKENPTTTGILSALFLVVILSIFFIGLSFIISIVINILSGNKHRTEIENILMRALN